MTASSPRPAHVGGHLRPRDRIVWSSLGALAPIILSLLDIDFNALLESLSVGALLGTVAQIAVYTFSAIVVVHFYPDEHSKSKLFHLGLAAPAFLAAIIGQAGPTTTTVVTNPTNVLAPLVSVAHAQSSSDLCRAALREGYDVKTVTPDEPGFVEQFVRGFTGQKPRGEHYVVIDSFTTAQQADIAKRELSSYRKGFILCGDFDLSEDADEPFVLMLGTGFLENEAQEIKEEVEDFGYSDARIWTP